MVFQFVFPFFWFWLKQRKSLRFISNEEKRKKKWIIKFKTQLQLKRMYVLIWIYIRHGWNEDEKWWRQTRRDVKRDSVRINTWIKNYASIYVARLFLKNFFTFRRQTMQLDFVYFDAYISQQVPSVDCSQSAEGTCTFHLL